MIERLLSSLNVEESGGLGVLFILLMESSKTIPEIFPGTDIRV
jgi:hypothetical protein